MWRAHIGVSGSVVAKHGIFCIGFVIFISYGLFHQRVISIICRPNISRDFNVAIISEPKAEAPRGAFSFFGLSMDDFFPFALFPINFLL